MIDIHCHILPGLDDGSPSLDSSIAMARLAAGAGTTDIVASPHADLQYAFDPAAVEAKLTELREAVGDVVRIHYGCDFHVHYENVQDALASPAKYTINHRNYLLVELSELLNVRTADDILSRLCCAGLVPVITHPERNGVLLNQAARLERWVLDGCCLQVTAQSLLGRFGRKARAFSQELLKHGLVQFVASDGHDCKHRPPVLDEACAWVREAHGDPVAERLFTLNPAAALEGLPLPE
ncbi:MAG TPA: CpsB/CapC family capsule biosynthesis tyrosine phosphatase, partial [Bryobacteraceae bacterium]|nr:CpsB/CapC family capsule biosynthesis tyrosine phosphatase [Bryobacteraceae bacterium]